MMALTTSITARGQGLPEHYENIHGYMVVKKVEALVKQGYTNIVVDSGELRYTMNETIQCSCLTYSPNKKECKTCITKTKSEVSIYELWRQNQ